MTAHNCTCILVVTVSVCLCDEDLRENTTPVACRLPVLYVVVHICKYSEEYCNVMIDEPFECIRRFAVVLAHGSQENVRQVAAWGLGVIGSQNAQFAQRVAESGGLLTIIAAMRGQRDENSPIFSTCQDSGCATVSKLEYLDALIALLDQCV